MRGIIDVAGVNLICLAMVSLFSGGRVMCRLCQWSLEVVLTDVQLSWVYRGLGFMKIAPLAPRRTTSRSSICHGQVRCT